MFLLTVDDHTVDVDELWNVLAYGLAPAGPVGRAAVVLAVACGLRLGTERSSLARALVVRIEQRMAKESAITPEEAEVTLRSLIDDLLARAEAGR